MRTYSALQVAAIALLLAACSGGGGTTAPQPGTLWITVNATGSDIGENHLTYAINGGAPVAIAVGDTAYISEPPGSYTVAISGLSANCSATSATSFPVTVVAGRFAHIAFTAGCMTRFHVQTTTTGTDLDIAYLVRVDSGPWYFTRANGPAIPVPGVTAGNHQVHFVNIASNCIATGGADHSITTGDTVSSQTYAFTCYATTRSILFGSTRDGGYDIYSMHADGTHTTRITNGALPSLHGVWSPDGTKIAFHAPAGTGFDIYVMNADGSGAVALTTDGVSGIQNLKPDWSPDGSKILFAKASGIYVMDANGAHQAFVHSGYAGRFSPDGTKIAFNDGPDISVMNADGTGATVIQSVPNFYSAYPAWSPDGTRILFVSPRDGASNDIFIMNANGTLPVNLTHGAGGDANEDGNFSPDGTKIVYWNSTNGSGNPGISIMNIDGTNKVNFATYLWDEFTPSWHP